MNNLVQKIPDQVIRLSVVVGLFFAAVLFVRTVLVPAELKETGTQRTSAIARELEQEVHYAGSIACFDCHDDVYEEKKTGYHRNLACESCHGAAWEHTEEPEEFLPQAPRGRKFCPTCHTYNLSRPTGFPQIDPVAHNPLQACIVCHNPHNPVPPETPRECTACHARISRMKAVSPHVFLDCTTCHATPDEHKLSPRKVQPGKPDSREFCAQCHDSDSVDDSIPQVDRITHGEKYLCWQCHFPHMPEVKL